jgi:hypothetical protein
VGVVALPSGAQATPVRIGDLAFDIPGTVVETPPDSFVGSWWQWSGRTTGSALVPDMVVLARADLPSTDPEEILGLALASSAAGSPAQLQVGTTRPRSMPGGGQQTRLSLTYDLGNRMSYHGTMLIATRSAPPAALLVVLGGDPLTANTIDALLGSARWLS